MNANQRAWSKISARMLMVLAVVISAFAISYAASFASHEAAYAEGETDISGAEIAAIADQTWSPIQVNSTSYTQMRTDIPITPALTVTYGGATLVAGTDYEVSYSDNDKVGTATATVTGIGSYTGTKSTTFQIVGPTHAPSVNWRDYYYNKNSARHPDPAEYAGKIWYKTVDGETWKGTNRYGELLGGTFQAYIGSGCTGLELVIPEGTTLYVGGPVFFNPASNIATTLHISGGGTVKRAEGYTGPLFVLQPTGNNNSRSMDFTFDDITFDGSGIENGAPLVILDSMNRTTRARPTTPARAKKRPIPRQI